MFAVQHLFDLTVFRVRLCTFQASWATGRPITRCLIPVRWVYRRCNTAKKEKNPPSCDSAKFAFQPERLTGRFFNLSKVTKSRILNRKLIWGGGGGGRGGLESNLVFIWFMRILFSVNYLQKYNFLLKKRSVKLRQVLVVSLVNFSTVKLYVRALFDCKP